MTVTFGLRYERLYGPLNEDLNPADFPVTLPYVDVSKRGDSNNIGPRTGVAWDVKGDGKTVVRTGYGIYYGHVRTLAALEEFRNYHRLSITITNPAYPDPYLGQDPHKFIVASTAPNLTIAANDMVQPLAHQASAGVSHSLSELFAIHVDAVYNRTYHDYKTLNINAGDPLTGIRPLPQFGRIDQVQSTSDLRYKAIYTKLEKRYSQRTQFLVSYAYTRSDDNQPFSRYLDPFDHSIDFGPSNGERRHAIVASGSVLLPADVTLGVVWTLRSQLPWSATAGRDLNKDTFNTDLVPGTTRNSGRDLNLDAVNAWRVSNGLAAIPASQIDSSRINNRRRARQQGATVRWPEGRPRRAGIQPVQHRQPGRSVQQRTRDQRPLELVRPDSHRAAESTGRAGDQVHVVSTRSERLMANARRIYSMAIAAALGSVAVTGSSAPVAGPAAAFGPDDTYLVRTAGDLTVVPDGSRLL